MRDDEVFGVMNIESPRLNEFDDADVETGGQGVDRLRRRDDGFVVDEARSGDVRVGLAVLDAAVEVGAEIELLEDVPQTLAVPVAAYALGRVPAQFRAHDALRRAIIYGSATGSFAVEDFSVDRFRTLALADVERRVAEFRQMTAFENELTAATVEGA